jgi:hypothetical protein
MRRLITITQVTLDGVMQAPGGPGEDPTNEFTHGGWAMPLDMLWRPRRPSRDGCLLNPG